MSAQLRVGVVGGGLGGLSAAIHLALQGHRVVLFERTERLGGKANLFEHDGYSFDTGPSLLTMTEVLDELFAAAGRDRTRELPLVRLDPQCRYFFPDGSTLELRDDREATLRNVASLSPAERDRFEHCLRLTQRIYETIGRPFLERPFEGRMHLARTFAGKPVAALKYGAALGMLADVARHSVSDRRLRWVIERYATYSGGEPERTPAAYAMILHVETAGGAWYPVGGIHRIVTVLGDLAKSLGVEVRLHARVARIVTVNGVVQGLLCSGDAEPFDAIVCNADPVTVGRHLLAPADLWRSGLATYQHQELALSGAVLLLGLRRRLEKLAHHNVVYPQVYSEEFKDVFDRRRTPRAPTVYVSVPSRTDPSRAPQGCESVFCMINAPALAEGETLEAERPAIIQRMKAVVSRLAGFDVDTALAVEHFIGPDDLRARFEAPGGSIYGISPHGRFSPFHRPLQRAGGLSGLYFAGGGTHPGGGIPLVLRSGRFAAELLQRDLSTGRLRVVRPRASA